MQNSSNDDSKDETMPDFEDFITPDVPRLMPRVKMMDPGGKKLEVIRANGQTEVIEMNSDDLKDFPDTSQTKRKNPDQRTFQNQSLAEARNAHTVVITREDGKMVQPGGERISDLIKARTNAPGISEEMKYKQAEEMKQRLLLKIGIRDSKEGPLRFPVSGNQEDHKKLAQQHNISSWLKTDELTADGYFGFRDQKHRGLAEGTKRLPILGAHIDRCMTEWSSGLLNFVTGFPMLNIPIATPKFLGWLIHKNWPSVADSFDVLSTYLCALRILCGGMDVGKKVIDLHQDQVLISEDPTKNDVNFSSAGQPLWALELENDRTVERKRLRQLRYPAWFDLGLGKNPTTHRKKKISDDELEKLMVQRAVENHRITGKIIQAQLHAALSVIQ